MLAKAVSLTVGFEEQTPFLKPGQGPMSVPARNLASTFCFIILILQHVCLILSYLTGPDLCPSPTPSPNLATDVKILEMLQVWKPNIFLGKYGGGGDGRRCSEKTSI